MLLVKITHTAGDRETWEHRTRTHDRDEARQMAIERHFGATMAWFPSPDLGPDFGTLCRWNGRINAWNVELGVRVDFEEVTR